MNPFSVTVEPKTFQVTVSAVGIQGPSGSSGAGGDVAGPASAVGGNLVAFSGTTGKLVTDAGDSVSAIRTSINGKEATGVADGLMTAHVVASNPHTQYILSASAGAFGFSMLGAASQSAGRTLLGLGTAAFVNTSAFESSGGIATHAALTSGVHGINALGASIVGAASIAAAQTALTLVPGTNVQAFDAELAAIAGLTSVADKLPYFTGSGTAALADISLAFRTFLTTPSSANLAALLTDETGSGANVFSSGPSITNLTLDQLTIQGNLSAAAWTTNGLRIKGTPATLTDTSSTGTVAAAYTDVLGGNTIAASSATTYTNYIAAFFREPVAGTNVTLSNKYALGAESIRVGTSNQLTVSTAGVLNATSPVFVTPTLGVASATGLGISTGTITDPATGLNIATTWNDAADTFDAFVIDVTSTASSGSSRGLNLKVGGSSIFNVTKAGLINSASSIVAANGASAIWSSGLTVGSTLQIGWSSTSGYTGTVDVLLYRDGPGILAQRNGSNSQLLNIENAYTSSTNNELVQLGFTSASNLAHLWTVKGSGGGTARPLALGADATELFRLDVSSKISFFGATTVVKQTSGANLTNNVTSGGTNDQVDNWTDLSIYAMDSAAIRNAIYQLARKQKQINDALRAYGLLT